MAKSRKQRERRERLKSSAKGWMEKRKSEFGNQCVKLPDGIEWLEIKDTKSRHFDFMSYKVGEGNPYSDPGMLHFERTYYVHRNLGPSGRAMAICPAKTFFKPCPVCEHREQLRAEGADKELLRTLNWKERQLWLVREVGPKGDGELKLWDVSHHLFGRVLLEYLENNSDESGFENFADPEYGMTLKLGFTEKSIGKEGKSSKFFEVSSILFKERENQYTVEECEEFPCLDDLLIETPYIKLKSLFYAEPEEEEDEDDEPKAKQSGKRRKASDVFDDADDDDEDEADDWDEDEDEEEEKPKAKKGKSSKSKRKVEEDDDDDWDEDEDEEEPKSKKKGKEKAKSSKSKRKVEEDDDDDDWDDDEDEDEEDDEVCKACKGSGKNSKGKPCPICSAGKKGGKKRASADDSSDRNGDDDEEDEVDDDDWDDDEEEEEKPKAKKGKSSKATKGKSTKKKKNKKDDDDDDDDDDDWD